MDTEGALELLHAATRADPRFFPAHHELIWIHWAFEEQNALLSTYGGLDRRDPFFRCLAEAASYRKGEGARVARALAEIESVHGPNGCTSTFLAELGPGHTTGEEWSRQALEHAQRAVRFAPEIQKAWSNLAVALRERGRSAEAVAALTEGARRSPHALPRTSLLTQLAMQEIRSGRGALPRAIESAVRRDGRPGVRAALAVDLSGLVDPSEYRTSIRATIAEYLALSDRHGGWRERYTATFTAGTRNLDYLGDPAGALDHLERLVAIADSVGEIPLRMQARVFRGRTLAKLGRLEDAERDLRAAVALGETGESPYYLTEAWHNLAHVYEGRGDYDRAIAAADRFIENADTLWGVAIRVMSWRDAGMIRAKAGRPAEADAAFRGMVRTIEDHDANHYWAGEYFERKGDLDRALGYYRRGLRDGSETPYLVAGLAR